MRNTRPIFRRSTTVKLSFRGDMQGLQAGLDILSRDFGYEQHDSGLEIRVERRSDHLIQVEKNGPRATIRYAEKIHFFRALGLLLEALPRGEDFTLAEEPQFTMNGAMFDVSQTSAIRFRAGFCRRNLDVAWLRRELGKDLPDHQSRLECVQERGRQGSVCHHLG